MAQFQAEIRNVTVNGKRPNSPVSHRRNRLRRFLEALMRALSAWAV